MTERIGLGSELPSKNAVVGPNGLKIESEPVLEIRTPDLLVRSRSNYFAKSCQRSG